GTKLELSLFSLPSSKYLERERVCLFFRCFWLLTPEVRALTLATGGSQSIELAGYRLWQTVAPKASTWPACNLRVITHL
ncbi:unnamed protein product, partial [Brassica napus]